MCAKVVCVINVVLCAADKSSPHLQALVILLVVVCEVTCFTRIVFGVCITDLAFNSLAQFVSVPARLHNWEL